MKGVEVWSTTKNSLLLWNDEKKYLMYAVVAECFGLISKTTKFCLWITESITKN
ncbi:hypothetical protein [Enterococcus phage phiFL1C]|uniref:Uncharacterized protein gp26 n=1 Tax=Enterococcus phage phiFL1C TaxID=673834 RepID=D2IZ72_9CAUD|nr:hypothetical protein [Enterococcus phage phiFL1C]